MIQVRIAAGLLEKMLTTGNRTQGEIEVVSGLPDGAHLACAAYDNGYVSLYFTEPDRRDNRDVEIVLRSHR